MTVGVGHLLTELEIDTGIIEIPISGKLVDLTEYELTESQIFAIFINDIAPWKKVIKKYVNINISRDENVALLSFIFNLGYRAFFNKVVGRIRLNSPNLVLSALNDDNCYQVSYEMRKFVYSGDVLLPGLIIRRKAEAELFLRGCYGRQDKYNVRYFKEN